MNSLLGLWLSKTNNAESDICIFHESKTLNERTLKSSYSEIFLIDGILG